MSKIFFNSYVPEYVSENLPWYECDGLMTYIDHLKWKEFISDSDASIKNTTPNVKVCLVHFLTNSIKP